MQEENQKQTEMAFFKKVQKKLNNLWYPQAVTVGKPVTTDEVSKRLAAESTVSPADTYAVLKALGGVLGDYMAQGRTVKLDGLGTFYYTCQASGNGAETPEGVTAASINGVRVQFLPEARRKSGSTTMTRSLVSDNVFWVEWGGTEPSSSGDTGGGGSSEDGDNPIG